MAKSYLKPPPPREICENLDDEADAAGQCQRCHSANDRGDLIALCISAMDTSLSGISLLFSYH